jgi:hypothetical protein
MATKNDVGARASEEAEMQTTGMRSEIGVLGVSDYPVPLIRSFLGVPLYSTQTLLSEIDSKVICTVDAAELFSGRDFANLPLQHLHTVNGGAVHDSKNEISTPKLPVLLSLRGGSKENTCVSCHILTVLSGFCVQFCFNLVV